MLQQNEASSRVKLHLLNEYQEKWRAAATNLVRLLKYVSINMQALRKTVKKQHKVVRSLKPHAHTPGLPLGRCLYICMILVPGERST
jgi:hypothetical protein